jgi:hypothetical protein
MRLFFWPMICLWLLKLSLSAGMVMAHAVADPLQAATATGQSHHTEHAKATPALMPDCHGPSTAPAKPARDDAPQGAETSDLTHCTAHADCHHCCPLAWGNWAGIGLQAAPTQPPARQVALWHSASWLPALRPPKA